MLLDASAILAILRKEVSAPALIAALEAARGSLKTSPQARFEAVSSLAEQISGSRKEGRSEAGYEEAEALVSGLLKAIEAQEVEITTAISAAARAAAAKYGEISGHPAQLSMSDCFNYACARAMAAHILSIKEGFTKIDQGGEE